MTIAIFGISEYLRDLGHRTETSRSCEEAILRIREYPFDVIICDVNLGEKDGFHLLEWAAKNAPDTAVIMLTGYGTIESAVEAIRMGAFEYLTKPVIDQELQLAIERALAQRQIVKENKNLKAKLDRRYGRENIVGNDYKMAKLFDLIESVADTRATVLIYGESGTGKTMTARAIHQMSSRRDRPFVEVPCGALAETLLESELFGHTAGAFTGANQDKKGKILLADGGTLFLDEIATASPALQVKLLRVLQDREFEPVGSGQTHKVDVRLVLATHENLEDLVATGKFRQDLYYRINVITLRQPPLRERLGDIPLLVAHYLTIFNEQNNKQLDHFTDEALDLLQRYDWPGNVRELVNVVERAVVLCRQNVVTPAELPESLRDNRMFRGHLHDDIANGTLKEALADPERHLIIDALEANGWNRQKTARILGINRTTLYKKMKKYGIRFEHEHSYN
jgi:two-component system response regulator HydG